MSLSLNARLNALEHRFAPQGPSVWVRCATSQDGDSPELVSARLSEARDAYIAAHGEPLGGLGVIHRSIIRPARHGGSHA